MDIQADLPEGTSIPEPRQIRITSQGKMRGWIESALNHFKTSNTPLILHTLPATQQCAETPRIADAAQSTNGHPNSGRMSVSTCTISRLISVVEIIKREYLNSSEKTVLSGLHQYNEISYLERDFYDAENGARTQILAVALEGKNYPKERKSAYMKITLSKCALPHLTKQNATYQLPLERRLSKSAKTRARKRQRKGDADDTTHIQ